MKNEVFMDELFNKGLEQFQSGQYEAALELFAQIIAQDPRYLDAWYQKGAALQKLGRYGEAIVVNQFFSTLATQQLGQTLLIRQCFEQGYQQALLDNFEAALGCYDKVLKMQPENSRAWFAHGSALSHLNRHEEAIASFDRAIEISPNRQKAWDGRGVALSHINRHEEAIASFDHALEYDSNNQYTWCNRGITLCDYLAEYEEAITCFDRALEIAPNFHEAWYNRGVSLSKLSRHEEAIASYDKALELKLDNHKAWHNRASDALLSPSYNQFLLSSEVTLSQQYPRLNQRGYPGQLVTLEFGLTQVVPHSDGWGHLRCALGQAHFQKGRREQQQGHNPDQYWEKARFCLDLALSALTAEEFPSLRLETLEIMIRVLLAQGKSEKAQTCRQEGAELLRTLLNQDLTAIQKQQIEAKFSGFSQIEVDVWLQSDQPITAIETADRYKNRCLNWILEAWQETIVSPSYAAIRSLCSPDTALIYWHRSLDNLATFLLLENSDAPKLLRGDRTAQAQQLTDWLKDWQPDYRDYASKKILQSERQKHPWRQKLEHRLTHLSEILQIETLCQSLPSNIQNLILIPHQDLHLLPLHALFPDHFKCSYLPSAQIGLNLNNRSGNNSTYIPLLSIEDPPTEQDPMYFAQLESAIVRYLVKSATPISGDQATTTNVLNHLKKTFTTFHFTGHSKYDTHRPKDSALALADGLLTAETIAQQDLSSYQLIVLSACETALTGNDNLKTEYIGLASAFLKAGAANVLSTLWPVDEISSCWFIVRFYQCLAAGKPPRIAFQKAQHCLKTVTWQQLAGWIAEFSQQPELEQFQDRLAARAKNTLEEGTIMGLNQPTKYSHSYYWGAFTLTGRG
jgi:CHAT domain-containing protein/Flp pilus assembly protein TadD